MEVCLPDSCSSLWSSSSESSSAVSLFSGKFKTLKHENIDWSSSCRGILPADGRGLQSGKTSLIRRCHSGEDDWEWSQLDSVKVTKLYIYIRKPKMKVVKTIPVAACKPRRHPMDLLEQLLIWFFWEGWLILQVLFRRTTWTPSLWPLYISYITSDTLKIELKLVKGYDKPGTGSQASPLANGITWFTCSKLPFVP